MAEILAVTWGEDELTLRRIPSEGIWNQSAPAVKRVPIERPTRAGRFEHPDVGEALEAGIVDLLSDIDVNVPCWLLLPNNWTLRFITEPPNLKTPDMILNHLRWEAKLRISGDPEDYKISAALLLGGAKYFVCITRTEVIEKCLQAADLADLELSGIGLEPNSGETYTFEHPLDLRDGLPLELPATEPPVKPKKKASPVVAGAFIGVVLLIIVGLLYFSGGESPPKPKQVEAKSPLKKQLSAKEASTPPEGAMDTVISTAQVPADTLKRANLPVTSEKPVGKGTETAKSSPAPSKEAALTAVAPPGKPAFGKKSPVSTLASTLPLGARIELLVLSPMDLKAEISGLANPTAWLAGLKKEAGFSGVVILGNYEGPTGRVYAIQILNPGWSSQGGVPSDAWQTPAKSAGLGVKGKQATGAYEPCITLFDKLWADPTGLSKVYLAPSGKDWQITVQ